MSTLLNIITHDAWDDEPQTLSIENVANHVVKDGILKATLGPGTHVYVPLHRILRIVAQPQPPETIEEPTYEEGEPPTDDEPESEPAPKAAPRKRTTTTKAKA